MVLYIGGYVFKSFNSQKNNTKEDIKIDVVDSLTATGTVEISNEEKKQVLDSLSAKKTTSTNSTEKSISQEEREAILKSLEAR